jgi:hypothetical protein
MVLTPEEVAMGRRNFIKAMAGAPPLLAFGAPGQRNTARDRGSGRPRTMRASGA